MERKIEFPNGCGADMGDVKCGDDFENFDAHRGEMSFFVIYCKECTKLISEGRINKLKKDSKEIE